MTPETSVRAPYSGSNIAAKTGTCAVGIDVGGTKIAGGLLTPGGKVLVTRIMPTLPQRGGEAVLSDALRLAEELILEASRMRLQVRGIGVAVAELVDLEGNVASDNCIAWRSLPVRAAFARLAPAVVEADARAAALAGLYKLSAQL